MNGKMIVWDGLDGTGKDTIIFKVTELFKNKGVNYALVRDPTDAFPVRDILLSKENLEEGTRLYLYLASRSELLYKQVIPAMKKGKVVLCNRYELSSYAYQGVFFSVEDIREASRIGKLDAVRPDLQIVYLSYRSFREPELEDVMGKYCSDYRKQIIDKYVALAKYPEFNIRLIWVDGKSVEQVFTETCDVLRRVVPL